MKYKPRILVVEDEPLIQELMVRRLAGRGFRVATASSGTDALKYLETEVPDLILLDVQLPELNGIEVLAKVRERFTPDALPVLLITALGETDDVLAGLKAGANDYIVKPVSLPVLLARMNVWLQLRHDVMLLMEAERQRVLIQALGEACHQLAQPMTAVTVTLETLIHHPPSDPQEMAESLRDVLKWTRETADVIHKMQKVGTLRPVPYTERLESFTS
jgi:DNA-binding response OmpR family regulator